MYDLHPIPPSPEVLATLYAEYKRRGVPGLSFKKYLDAIGFTNPAHDHRSLDAGRRITADLASARPELIDVPRLPVSGKVEAIVLLVDFGDRPGMLTRDHYEDLLFSERSYPSGSMRDFYREVSLGKVEVAGSVHGWLRMPQPYSYYTNGQSGLSWNSYPRNAPRMAEDAVRAALDAGVRFEPSLDKLGQRSITALIIVHAGRGAETITNRVVRGLEIWSHKWTMRNPIEVAPGLRADLYLTVPYDCQLGVCAHEVGHLVFQWQDFYDPNYDQDGSEWDGAGRWDLMAGGSYNGNGQVPAHPAGLHKSQHGWIEVVEVNETARSLRIDPYTAKNGSVVKVKSPAYEKGQYLLLENRTRQGFDFGLPGEGLLVWRVDEKAEQERADVPGMLLLQADGRHDLENPDDWNQGDAGDPFPGDKQTHELHDTGDLSTTFPGGARSGVSLSKIRRDPATGVITLDVVLTDVAAAKPKGVRAGAGRGRPQRSPGRRKVSAHARPRKRIARTRAAR